MIIRLLEYCMLFRQNRFFAIFDSRAVAAFAAVATAVSCAACGVNGPGKSTSAVTSTAATTTAATSRSLAEANRICERLNTLLDGPLLSAQRNISAFALKRAALQRGAITDLNKIAPPVPVASDYRKMIAIRRVLVAETVKLAEDAAAHRSSAARRLFQSSGTMLLRMSEIARRNGLNDCATLG
jgi:hypothetical protein